MDYKGEKFLDNLYKDLCNSYSVNISRKRMNLHESNKYRDIRAYLQRLEYANSIASNNHKKDILFSFYYNKYVIREENIDRENAESIINSQKKSLKAWLEYLNGDNPKYPMWAKYWAFQGMVRMGAYNSKTHKFNKRTDKTVAPFPPFNSEVIANSVVSMIDIINENQASINDSELKSILEGGNFSKIYTYFYNKMRKEEKKASNMYDGIWIKYNEGSKKEASKLYDSLKNKATGWCTANDVYAINQICGGGGYPGGDFYIYYTKDIENNYANPRIAIRMDGTKKIGEIRGISDGENIEYGLEDIIKEKLLSFSFLINSDRERYLEIINDQKRLTKIHDKTGNNEKLTQDEVLFLYEVNHNIKSFGEESIGDSRIDEIKEEREIKGLLFKDFEDKDTLLKVLEKDSSVFNFAKDDLKDNEEFVEKVMRENPTVFRYVSERLAGKKDFVIKVVSKSGYLLKYAAEKLRDDKEVSLVAIKNYSGAVEYVSDRLKEDPDILIETYKGDYYDRMDSDIKIPKFLLDDDNFLIKAVSMGAVDILENKRSRLKDKGFVINLINVCPENSLGKFINYLDSSMIYNEEIRNVVSSKEMKTKRR